MKNTYALILSIGIPLAAFIVLTSLYGSHTGANFDAYQYTFALREGKALPQAEFDNASRLFVHAGYYVLLRPLIMLGLDAWTVFSLSSMLFMSLASGLLYVLCRELGSSPEPALALAVMFGLSSTALHYCNIPEIYPMWLVTFIATLLALWRRNVTWSVVWFALSFVAYVQSILLLPAFLLWGWRRGTFYATLAAGLGFALLMIILQVTGVSLLANLFREKVYLEIATQDPLWLKSNFIALRQSGAIVPLLLAILLWRTLGMGNADKFLLASLLPNILFALLWVNNHGAFFLPTALLASVLLATQISQVKSHRAILAVAIIMTLSTFPWAWDEASYDRSLGKVQYDFCTSSFSLVKEERLISTALFPRWQYVYSLNNTETKNLKYSPWAFARSQEQAMVKLTRDLVSGQESAYADYTVHPEILSQLAPAVVYSHAGVMPGGSTLSLTLYRVSIEQRPE